MKPAALNRFSRKGFSLVEMLVTVSIIGVLAGIAIPVYSNMTTQSRDVVAGDHVEALNAALKKFSQNCWQITTAADNAVTTDELLVLRSLQYKFPVSSPKVGSPYFDPRYSPSASSSTNDLRIRWNGSTFELLKKGTAGTGMKYDDGKEYATSSYSFPANYSPEH